VSKLHPTGQLDTKLAGVRVEDFPTTFDDVVIERRRIVPFTRSIRVGRFLFPTSVVDAFEPIEGLDVSRFPMRIALESRGNGYGGVEVAVRINVRDRDNPERWIWVTLTTAISEYAIHDEGLVEAALYQFVEHAVKHELDECWLVNGTRTRDPHKGDQRP